MERTKSFKLFEKARGIMPGGVSSPVRAFRAVGGSPVYFKRAAGPRFWDEDGNEYLDLCMSWGPLILGHADPAVVEAVHKTAADGLSFGTCNAREVELAELVLKAFPGMEQVRFTSSGTEAVMTAIRLARGVTGRDKILKFEGGYHGHSDSLLVKAGSGLITFGTSSSRGVPEALAAQTVVLPFNDERLLEKVFAKVGDTLAAVIVEPLPANNGLLEQRPEWLKKLRRLADKHGSLLILDEVISGFRFRFGGYGDGMGIRADIVTLGKILGGGMPAAALAGPRKTMEALAPVGGVYQAGTLSGNPVSLAAGIATLEQLAVGGVYEKLESLGARLDRRLEEHKKEFPFLNWRRLGSVTWFHLAPGEVPRDAGSILSEAVKRFNGIYAGLLDRGVYLPPSAYEVFFLSTAHTPEDVDMFVNEFAGQLRRNPVSG
ncbi:MAG: glutamate-1-semialdehyde 2,1-aminomutase [Nanoarchaeota archaeon]|nr:glutamate-1-semialdehyde 2,1-aminomutase [Nanoarchaeota archaeon]